MATVALVALAMCAALGAAIGDTPPHTHDEFGYLLIGDTFSHGRVTNPPHERWQHFESVHILQQPTYTSKYPPAQGLALAFGESVVEKPIVGVWITVAFAAVAIYWMLLAWTRPRWALVGGLMTALHPQMIVWSQNYWGGTIALAGGAIVLGAFRRLLREPTTRDSICLSLGMAILANSRPYEGFVFSALICLTLLVFAITRSAEVWRTYLTRVGLPWFALMMVLSAQVGYYNYRITGSVLRMPYVVCEETYGISPLFIFQKEKPEPAYRHAELRALQEDYLRFFRAQRASASALIKATGVKIHTILESCMWSRLLLVPLLAALWAIRRDRWLRLSIPGGVLFSAAMLLGTWALPHYAAPAAGVFIALVITSMRRLKVWSPCGRRSGLLLVRGTLCLCALSSFLPIWRLTHRDINRWDFQRAHLLHRLESEPGSHLVFVHYRPDHNPHREWVYNAANIDRAKVVLARIMSPEQNAALRESFADRRLWLIEADANPATLTPLESSASLPRVHPLPTR